MRSLHAFGIDLADALLGHGCLGCGSRAPRGRIVCDGCDAAIPRTGVVLCLRCMQEGGAHRTDGDPGGGLSSGSGAGSGCPRHGSERLLLAGPPFEPPLDRVVHAFKYSGARGAHSWIAGFLPEPPGRGTVIWREYLLVPVPLHPSRRTWRGFDQAKLLAEAAGAQWGIPVVDVLLRTRDHSPQARLRAEARRENVRDAFLLAGRGSRLLRSRPVLLVDDVATTGSTLIEAAAAVQAGGPSWTLSLSACHGGLPPGPETPSSASVATTGRV